MASSTIKNQSYYSKTDLGAFATLERLGNIGIISMTNAFPVTAFPLNGIDIGIKAKTSIAATCLYYDGTSNTNGFLKISNNILKLTDKNLADKSAHYITGELTFFIDEQSFMPNLIWRQVQSKKQ